MAYFKKVALYIPKKNKMKKYIISGIIGFIGGIAGALIFEPISGIFDVVFSDFAIGGIIVGILGSVLATRITQLDSLAKKLLFNVGIGLVVFLVFGLLSGQLMNDLIAGFFIGLMVGLTAHFLKDKVTDLVDAVEDKIENSRLS